MNANSKEAARIRREQPFYKVQDKQINRDRLRKAVTALIVVLLGGLFLFLCGAIFLRVRVVTVRGASKVDPARVVEVGGIKKDDNLFAVDRADIRAAIMEEFPYIADVEIKRTIPSTIELVVKEDEAVYYTEFCGEYFVLSDKLRVLEKTSDKDYIDAFSPRLISAKIPDCVYAVVGEEIVFSNDSTFSYAQEMLSALGASDLFDGFTALDFSSRFHITVTYKDRWRIYVGSAADLPTKLTFARMMMESFDETQSGEIDAHDITLGSVLLDGIG